jgi:hypothetical protein
VDASCLDGPPTSGQSLTAVESKIMSINKPAIVDDLTRHPPSTAACFDIRGFRGSKPVDDCHSPLRYVSLAHNRYDNNSAPCPAVASASLWHAARASSAVNVLPKRMP